MKYSVRSEVVLVDRRDVIANSEDEAIRIAQDDLCAELSADAPTWYDDAEITDCCVLEAWSETSGQEDLDPKH